MEKIILGKKRFIGNQNTDEFIDIELTREIENLKTDTLYNTFDFQEQFIKDRNNSLKFCLYGLIESRYGHCDNLMLNIKINDTNQTSASTNTIIYTPYNFSAATSGYSFYTSSKPLSNNSDLTKNIYGTNKGCYFFHFEVDKNDANFNKNKSIYIQIFEPVQELYGEFSIPFLFFDENQELIEFGTETAEFNEDNEIETINNNFPFFYDKHWIKFNLEPHGPQVASFVNSEMTIKEDNATGLIIPITLEEPSKFGLEKVKIVIDYNVNEFGEPLTNSTLGIDFLFNEQVVSWNIGEQIKEVFIDIKNDLFVENIEKIQFRLIPILNTRVSINTNNSMILYIESEDVPVSAYFNVGSLETFRPLYSNTVFSTNNPFYSTYNSISSLTHNVVPITIFFSSPVPVNGEKIKVKYNQNSTAKIGTDFSINNPNSLDTEIDFGVFLGSNALLFDIYVKSHKGYIEDREIILDLFQSTLGIVPVSQSNTNSLPQIKIKLKDSTLPISTRFVLPFNSNRSVGIFKKIFTSNSIANKYITLKKDSLDAQAPVSISQHNLTNDFRCNLEIENLGETIIFNNQIINRNDKINIALDLSAFTQNYNIDLPANYDWRGVYYNQSKYRFYFRNIEKTFPTGTTTNLLNWTSLNPENQIIYSPNYLYTAGLSGSKQYWLVTEIKDSFSVLDTANNLCLTSATAFNTSSIYYNGAIIAQQHPFYQKTISKIIFSTKRVVEECGGINGSLPVGTILLPSPPYNQKFANINFGEILIQLKHSSANITSKMYLESILLNTQGQLTNSHIYFVKWNSSYIETKTSLILEVFNDGIVDVEFLGKIISVNDSQFYNSSEVYFGNLSLTLPANDNYQVNGNYFKNFNYKFKLHNIKIPHSLTNNPTFETIQNYAIGNLNVSLTQNQINSNLPTNFYIENKYNNIGLSANIFGNLLCGIPPSLSQNIIYKKVLINRVLIFTNTGSNLLLNGWNNNFVASDCNSTPIPFKIV